MNTHEGELQEILQNAPERDDDEVIVFESAEEISDDVIEALGELVFNVDDYPEDHPGWAKLIEAIRGHQ